MKEETFIVQCNVCGQQFENMAGSTPCCGSIAYLLDEKGEKTESIILMMKIKEQ